MSRMTKSFLLAVGGVFLFGATSGCGVLSLYDKLQARNELNEGVKAYSSQKYDQAIEHFKASVAFDPQLVDAQLYLATAYRAQFVPGSQSLDNLQMAKQAISAFEVVLEIDPKNNTSLASIAGIHNSMGDYENAKVWYRKQLEADPTNPEPLYAFGTINWQLSYDKTGMTGENVEYLTEEENAEVTQLIDEGVGVLKEAIEIRPGYTEAMQYLNLLYREKGKLATEEEEKQNWELEADKLALEALEMKRKQEEEAEKARRTISGAVQKEE